MGASKSDQFNPQVNRIATLAKAMGHPARVSILQYLSTQTSCICGDIVDKLPLAQPTVSRHLKELKDAGIIKGEINGTAICYCIDEGVVEELSTFLESMKELCVSNESNCC